tara:strand:+ start:125041 stop:125784 length:744 start_codon:yes stop_codon:yes gene_type:complete
MTQLSNLKIINDTDKDTIFQGIAETGASVLNATNGTYTAPDFLVVPTTLGGFQFVTDKVAGAQDALIMAINSDKSMQDIAAEKAKKGEDIGVVEDQVTRAEKVLVPLAKQFPERQIIGVFYDESTPTELYEFLKDSTPLELNSLFKFGYGTDPKAGDIEGADCFKVTLAFPMPNDQKPLCHDLTKVSPNRAHYAIHKLTEELADNGAPYMSKENKVLFPLAAGLKGHKGTITPPTANGDSKNTLNLG